MSSLCARLTARCGHSPGRAAERNAAIPVGAMFPQNWMLKFIPKVRAVGG